MASTNENMREKNQITTSVALHKLNFVRLLCVEETDSCHTTTATRHSENKQFFSLEL